MKRVSGTEAAKPAAPAAKTGDTVAAAEPEQGGKSANTRNVQYLKPRVVSQKTSAAGGDWTEF
jgi:hypothetical protein